ncbi:MAG: thiamine pyrophosphate-binding protein [Alphaproteobacteria bacterium]
MPPDSHAPSSLAPSSHATSSQAASSQASSSLATQIIRQLKTHGVKRIFGIPGGGSSLALIEAAGHAGIDFILTRTETAAAFMAAVTGESTGAPGVLLTGIGPGATSAVNGVAYAYLEKSPVILITDGPASTPHQALDQNALYRPITKLQGRLRPEDGADEIEKAIHTALAKPWGPVQLDLTADDASTSVSGKGATAYSSDDRAISPKDIEQAGRLIAASRKPVILAGLEARHEGAPAALRHMADILSCPVLLSYKASGVLPASHAGFTGLFTGAMAEADILHAADLIILFGLDAIEIVPGRWPYESPVLELRAAPATPLPVEPAAQVTGDLSAIAEKLAPNFTASEWRPGKIAQARKDITRTLALHGAGHTCQSAMEAAAELAAPGARLTVDAGAHMFSALACWPAEAPLAVFKSNGLSSMGYALPAAIALSLENPRKPVLAITGDGGMMMCLSELATAVEQGCNITVLVINDAALSLIDIKQQRQQYKSSGVHTQTIDFATCAMALGCPAWRVEPEDDIRPVLMQAFAQDGPALIDVAANAEGYGDQLVRLRG